MTECVFSFYVAPDGDNANPGTRDRPWATPGYGSRQLAPGDTLVILGGRYVLREYDADIITPPSGTAQAAFPAPGLGHRRGLPPAGGQPGHRRWSATCSAAR